MNTKPAELHLQGHLSRINLANGIQPGVPKSPQATISMLIMYSDLGYQYSYSAFVICINVHYLPYLRVSSPQNVSARYTRHCTNSRINAHNVGPATMCATGSNRHHISKSTVYCSLSTLACSIPFSEDSCSAVVSQFFLDTSRNFLWKSLTATGQDDNFF